MTSYGSIPDKDDKKAQDNNTSLAYHEPPTNNQTANTGEGEKSKAKFLSYLIYAFINVIIAVPGLYGYASVIFNHPTFQPEIAKLSKLVVFSSFVHQLGFVLFSKLDFAIGTVQDAGLIFLSVMANGIADRILDDGGSVEEVISTTLLILPLGTAALGLVLICLGKFKLLDIVSYLPLPVIGGYLAFIGYFCLQSGVALCIGETMTEIHDWKYLLDPHNLLLATPGLLSALLLTVISRKSTNDACLPLAMVLIPTGFYAVLLFFGITMEEARDGGWVGEVAPPVQASELLHMVDLKLVRWDLITECVGTWLGMVFVVSFASCLDIAAISMDMGEALDTNGEMVTIGISNFLSGCLMGFTGSYIFSQTIFTYRTGCHSRVVGVMIMGFYLLVCISTINILQIAPLFFLGATLIFIGYDLLWEWLIDIREKIYLMEYVILLITFVAIQIIGMDFGILFGVVVAVIDHVASTTRHSSMGRVVKRSRAVWPKEAWDILQLHGYRDDSPAIQTIEIKGPVFFGSSQKLLNDITQSVGLNMSQAEIEQLSFAGPHVSTPLSRKRGLTIRRQNKKPNVKQPQYIVLDMNLMHNLDASAASSCFLQLATLCEKRGIFLCASGTSSRVEWMLRSHGVAYDYEKELEIKKSISSSKDGSINHAGKVLLFLTVFEALQFCERMLIQKYTHRMPLRNPIQTLSSRLTEESPHHRLTYIIQSLLRETLTEEENKLVGGIVRYSQAVKYEPNQTIFLRSTHPDAFYIVINGSVAIPQDRVGVGNNSSSVLSGAGHANKKSLSQTNLLVFSTSEGEEEVKAGVESFHEVGAIFGYLDLLLNRYRTFDALAAKNEGAVCAMFTRASMGKMKAEDPQLYVIMQNLLLKASLMDLANCTCHN